MLNRFLLILIVFTACSSRAEDRPLPVQLLLSTEFRGTLDSEKMRKVEKLATLGNLGGLRIPSFGSAPRVSVAPDPKISHHVHVTGVTDSPFRVQVKPFGNNRNSIDSVRRGPLNNLAIVVLGRDEIAPEGVGVHEFTAGGRRYAVVWQADRLSTQLGIPLAQVEARMPALAREFATGMRMVVHDEGASPTERRQQASASTETHR